MADLDRDMETETEQPVSEEQRTEQNRGDGGRFAEGRRPLAGGGDNDPGPDDAGAEGDGSERQQMVPHQALHAAREEAKQHRERATAIEREVADLRQQQMQLLQQMAMRQQPQQPAEPPPPPPDWFQDPDQAFRHNFGQYLGQAISPLQQAIVQQREQFSQMMAVEKYGVDAVQQAEAELAQYAQSSPQQARYDWQRIMAAPHPYGELMNWHKQRTTLNRVGGDPDAYIEQELQRRLAEMGHAVPPPQNGSAQSQPRQAGSMPSSFASARHGGPRSGGVASSGARSLSEIMGR
jgi:hypothetical protein